MATVADPSAVHHEVAYLLGWKQHLVPELESLGVRTHLLAGHRGLSDIRWVGRLRRLRKRFDLIHLHSPAVAAVARPVLRAARHPPLLVSTEHNVWGSHGRATRIANALTSPLDRVRWAVSGEVVASMWPPWRRGSEVLVHGVPVVTLSGRRGEREAIRAERGWAPDEVVVATVANLRANKDYPTLFAAAAEALREEPRLRFASIGQGPLEHELLDALAAYDLGDRFLMLGYHEDPPAVLAGADVFTLSSRHEGLPISLLEAMALGIPPVVTSVGGNAQVLTNDVDGLLVPPGRPDALAAAFVRLARSPDDRGRLASAAAERVYEFDISRTARVVEARYQEFVD
jgi:glycosyltransferase involved in cell wall biosynthesis